MRVAVTQPNYLPWLGYFALLDRVDLFVSLDNVQLVKRSFIVRNRIRRSDGEPAWLSLKVASAPRETLLHEAQLAGTEWATRHLDLLSESYRGAAHAPEMLAALREMLPPRVDERTVSAYNERLLADLCGLLGIRHRCVRASSLVPEPAGTAQDKMLQICRALREPGLQLHNFARGVDIGLYDGASFRQEGIGLWKQAYEHPSYRQLGAEFVPYLSIVDLLLNEGEAALEILRSGDRWQLVG